jgi:hypothetical protein
VACAFAAYLSAVSFWVLRQPGGEVAARFATLAHVVPALGAALCCFGLASRRLTMPVLARVGWILLGIGALSFGTSQAAVTCDRLNVVRNGLLLVIADGSYLLAYPCLLAGLLALALAIGTGSQGRALLDSLISLGAPLALSWYFLLKPLARATPRARMAAAGWHFRCWIWASCSARCSSLTCGYRDLVCSPCDSSRPEPRPWR